MAPTGINLTVEEAAAAWIAKRESGHWQPDDETALEIWLDSATVNRVTFLRLDVAWKRLGRLNSLGHTVGRVTEPLRATDDQWATDVPSTPISSNVPRLISRVKIYAVAAAACVGAVIAGTAIYGDRFGDTRYESVLGAVSTATLSDGTIVNLDSASTILYKRSGGERDLTLVHGRVFLDVAKDPRRPFVVNVDQSRLTDIGTRFSVSRIGPEEAVVVVSEGTVSIAASHANDMSNPVISSGSKAHIQGESVDIQRLENADVETELSWRTGHLVFHETPLSEAIAEFNRYSERKLVIRSPTLGTVRIGGTFRVNDVDGFVALLERGFSVRVTRTADQIALTREK